MSTKTSRRLVKVVDNPAASIAPEALPRPEVVPGAPAGVSRIEHEPAVAGRHEAGIGTFKAGLGDDQRIIRMTTRPLASSAPTG
jgi:hypothetical protein